jgi:hypothetical protein
VPAHVFSTRGENVLAQSIRTESDSADAFGM